jgi:hypothetical protein
VIDPEELLLEQTELVSEVNKLEINNFENQI